MSWRSIIPETKVTRVFELLLDELGTELACLLVARMSSGDFVEDFAKLAKLVIRREEEQTFLFLPTASPAATRFVAKPERAKKIATADPRAGELWELVGRFP